MIQSKWECWAAQDNNEDWKTNNKKMPDEPPEGSWQTKVLLDCVLPKGIHSCPIGKDKHLAAS